MQQWFLNWVQSQSKVSYQWIMEGDLIVTQWKWLREGGKYSCLKLGFLVEKCQAEIHDGVWKKNDKFNLSRILKEINFNFVNFLLLSIRKLRNQKKNHLQIFIFPEKIQKQNKFAVIISGLNQSSLTHNLSSSTWTNFTHITGLLLDGKLNHKIEVIGHK